MRVKFIGAPIAIMLFEGKVYDVMRVEKGWYRIIDESKEDYLYPPELFEIVENESQEKQENTLSKIGPIGEPVSLKRYGYNKRVL